MDGFIVSHRVWLFFISSGPSSRCSRTSDVAQLLQSASVLGKAAKHTQMTKPVLFFSLLRFTSARGAEGPRYIFACDFLCSRACSPALFWAAGGLVLLGLLCVLASAAAIQEVASFTARVSSPRFLRIARFTVRPRTEDGGEGCVQSQ